MSASDAEPAGGIAPPRVRPFPDLIAALRKDANLTQDDLAALMGMPGNSGRTQVAQWETGARVVPVERLPKLAACLGYWPTKDSTLRREVMSLALALSYSGGHFQGGAA